MRTKTSLLGAGILLAALMNSVAQRQPIAPPRHVEGELLVKFKGGPPPRTGGGTSAGTA